MEPNDIGRKIKELRLTNNMTLEQVGNIVGVGKSTVRKWETGLIANMRRDKIAKLASALHTTPAYLMGWEDAEIKTEEDENNAEVIVFEGGSKFDLAKLPDGTREDLTKVVQILPYESSDDDFGLQVILDKEEILNLDALSLEKKKDLMKYIRFLLSDEN